MSILSNSFDISIISSAAPAWFTALGTNEVTQLTNTTIQAVEPTTAMKSAWPSGTLTKYVVEAWCGAAFDTTRTAMIIFGGGHGDYAGNEIYLLELNKATPTMTRITDPSPNVGDPGTGIGAYPDGLPGSSHSYDWPVYAPNTDELIRMTSSTIYQNRTDGGDVIWRYNMAQADADKYQRALNGWSRTGTLSTAINGDNRGSVAYNSRDGLVYLLNSGTGDIGTYNPLTGAITKLADVGTLGTYVVGDISPDWSTNGFYAAQSTTGFWVIDLSNGVVGTPGFTSPGFDRDPFTYDPVNNAFWSWSGGNTLFRYDVPANPLTDTWNRTSVATNGVALPASPQGNGTYGRMRYIPGFHGLALVNDWAVNAYAVRL